MGFANGLPLRNHNILFIEKSEKLSKNYNSSLLSPLTIFALSGAMQHLEYELFTMTNN